MGTKESSKIGNILVPWFVRNPQGESTNGNGSEMLVNQLIWRITRIFVAANRFHISQMGSGRISEASRVAIENPVVDLQCDFSKRYANLIYYKL